MLLLLLLLLLLLPLLLLLLLLMLFPLEVIGENPEGIVVDCLADCGA